MTETTQAPAVPIGQAVGQAEAVLTKLLARTLAQAGTSRQDYLAMVRLTALGGVAPREEYVTDLSNSLEMDLWAAGELADSLTAAGLLENKAGAIGFAPTGEELRGRIATSSGAVARSLVASLDPADVATTIRTLQHVTQRARDLLKAGARDLA